MRITTELLREMDLPHLETPEDARVFLEEASWGDGPVCLRCSCREAYLIPTRRKFQCKACGHQYSVTSGTVFHASKLPLNKWLLATAALKKRPIPILELADSLQVEQRTARRLRKLIFPEMDLRFGRREQIKGMRYPFIERLRPNDRDHELLMHVSQSVPHELPPDLRSDICQELVLQILCGTITTKDAPKKWRSIANKLEQNSISKYGLISLYAPINGTDIPLIERFTAEDSIWNMA